ncbi:MAG: sigma 54-interacting transcriptional regulator [Candidatus Zixiibacteriota bacterium]
MATTSLTYVLDQRLLLIEELLHQRKHEAAKKDLQSLTETDFVGDSVQMGFFLSLSADVAFLDGDYVNALEKGQKAAKLLAGSPHHRQYGRTLHVLSKTYWAEGDLKKAEEKSYDALASYRRAADSAGQVSSLNELAHIAFMRSDFKAATGFLDEAVTLTDGYPAKAAMLSGNLGRVRTLLGEWPRAEQGLKSALAYYTSNGDEASAAGTLISLGYLYLRKREFVFAENSFEKARGIVERLGLKRSKVHQREFAGELAFEKGDYYKAKALLNEAYKDASRLAPESALVTQAGRRLAEVELALDNLDAAMKYAQKALDLAVRIGEAAEISQSRRVIALVFAARSEFAEAIRNGREALSAARNAGDPVDLARTILALADLMVQAGSEETTVIDQHYDEAVRLFRRLDLDHWVAEASYQAGVWACRQGKLHHGFKQLSRAEKLFSELSDTARVRRVTQFLATIADQAVALSVSDDNEFKLFGKLINQGDLGDLDTTQMDTVIEVLRRRTGADRVVLVSPDLDISTTMSTVVFSDRQLPHFVDSFRRLLGEEISTTKPTLLLDCRRDPYVADLFPDRAEVIASVLVVPFRMGDGTVSYVYLDRLSKDGRLNPFNQEALNFAVGFSDVVAFKSAELQRRKLLEDNRRLKAQLMESAAFPNIITRNHELLQILDQVRQVIDSDISINIQGPTGSGKDLLARAIHYNSKRRDKRYISVNCAALPETLLESELFGYRRGAFTGADRDKPGLFEEADGGTFFLDEIADMPLSVQAKILRVLEEKELVRLGESTPRKVDVRIVSATNKDLKAEMSERRFRQDLYYRLAALTFKLPALADRREDIPLLVEHFLAGSGKRISSDTMKHLVAYAWPGNVRELDNEIKKLILLAGTNDTIGPELLSTKILSDSRLPAGVDQVMPYARPVEFGSGYSLYDYLASHERQFIVRALRERHGVKKHAAAMLNIPESTLRLKIKEYNIDLDRLDAVH